MKHMTKYKILIYEIIVIITNIDPKLPSKHSKKTTTSVSEIANLCKRS